LLRYRLDDRVRVLDDGGGVCPCGSPFRRLHIEGRTDDTLYLCDPQGRLQAHTPIPFEAALLGIDGLLQFSLVHTHQNRLQVFVVVKGGANPDSVGAAVVSRLRDYFDAHGLLQTVTVVVEQVEGLFRHGRSRKLRQITSAVPRPPGEVIPASACLRRPPGPAPDGSTPPPAAKPQQQLRQRRWRWRRGG
jgi:phenylacetate-coenzyme A ligase PaaK-like adenylate-forming protein